MPQLALFTGHYPYNPYSFQKALDKPYRVWYTVGRQLNQYQDQQEAHNGTPRDE